ncbi:DUF6193 family natural product biosynthesis protein [Streptomyces sp. NBC_01353]|uniref:DUF6193 family natural product biosynthesis protein n=1 Tax=Streptomyces sp. NBC_01353 TaxID=2903835 RepID=UPI002E3502E3|nr:DUF6193 family natural product biosynthesis protein [Streptomyces sp. NBC_01353]
MHCSVCTPASFLQLSQVSAAHERGPEHAVDEKRRSYLEPHTSTDLNVIRAAYGEPRLRALFPFTSHGTLRFSRCTGSPFSRDMSVNPPLGGRRPVRRIRGAAPRGGVRPGPDLHGGGGRRPGRRTDGALRNGDRLAPSRLRDGA